MVIEVSDDGHGLDRDKIVRKAIERRILSTEEAARLNEAETLQLIFAPGLSTADEVTEISGRGVGLDVVKSAVENLKGSVELESEPGKRHHLPPARAAHARQHSSALVPRQRAPLRRAYRFRRRNHARHFRGDSSHRRSRSVSVAPAGSHARSPGSARAATRSARPAKRVFVIVIGTGSRRFGLAVDSLMGEEELVIKALEDKLVNSPLVSGASILGDGTVVLILNVPAVVSHLARIPAVGATA